jgi:tRNA U34 5-carboxymethylaminomethyl modifying GTPase MnmE/TrmE
LNFIRKFIKKKNNNIDNENENIPIFIIINKNDIKDKFFQKETICSFFKDDLPFINIVETSARNNNDINNLFIQISQKLLGISFIENNDIFNMHNSTNNLILNTQPEQKNKKCNKCC